MVGEPCSLVTGTWDSATCDPYYSRMVNVASIHMEGDQGLRGADGDEGHGMLLEGQSLPVVFHNKNNRREFASRIAVSGCFPGLDVRLWKLSG